MEYYLQRGFEVKAVVPETYLDYEHVGNLRRRALIGIEVRAPQLPDNIGLLRTLRTEGRLIATPQHDYDDSYAIKFAKEHNGYIVSNDQYRDSVEKLPARERPAHRQWLRDHVIHFAFANEMEFVPNPDFKFQ